MLNNRREAMQTIAMQTAILAMPGVSALAGEAAPLYAYVGCRTVKERNGHGKGIGVYRVDRASGVWTLVQLVEGLDNPSFLAFDRHQRFLYSVHGDLGDISAHAVDAASGKLRLRNRQTTQGRNPAHLAVDPSNRFITIAHYASGSLATLPILPDGSLGSVVDLVPLPGTPGPHKVQQQSAHPHHVIFDRRGQFMLVPDKGLDKIFTYQIDAATGKLSPGSAPSVSAREGAGPRHIAMHPTRAWAYVVNELDSTITTYRYDETSGALAPLQIVSALPSTFVGENTGAEIAVHASGRFVFASNRGHDSIVAMSVNANTGLLSPIAWEPTQGKAPRFFTIDPAGTTLYAANQNGDSIVAFAIDPATGRLTPTGYQIETGSPVCIVFRDTAVA